LIDDDIEPRLVSLFLLRYLLTLLIFGLPIAISFISVQAAEYSWALIVLVRWLLPTYCFTPKQKCSTALATALLWGLDSTP
jgi:hypothetical protein